MPWFITAIVSKNPIEKHRTFGFFNSIIGAERAIHKNSCDMHECLYDYIVLEYIEEGIHPDVKSRDWYQYNNDCWNYIDEFSVPEYIRTFSNWSLG